MSPRTALYCSNCGEKRHSAPRGEIAEARLACERCGTVPYDGPRVLILGLVWARGCMLLMQRGQPPYMGQWAPPGGYVEHGESLEGAVAREIQEETGVVVDAESMIPYGIVSLPSMNQIYAVYTTRLADRRPAKGRPPESLDARWVSEDEFTTLQYWEPAAGFDMSQAFQSAASSEFEFFQKNETFLRRFTSHREPTYLQRKDDGVSRG